MEDREIEMWKYMLTSTCSETLKTMEKVGANLQEFYDPKIIGIQKRVVEASARASAEIERLKIRNDELNALHKTASIEAIREFAEKLIEALKDALYFPDIKEKTITREEMRKRFEALLHTDIPEVIEYVKEKMVGEE